MKSTKTKWFIFIGIIAVILLVTVIAIIANSALLLWIPADNNNIRNKLLKITPIGTSMEETVEAVISKVKWQVRSIKFVKGREIYLDTSFEKYHISYNESGEDSIHISNKFYFILIPFHIDAYYSFDKNSNLIEIDLERALDIEFL